MLTDRIDAIVKIANKAKIAADIGCDHGYTSIKLISNYKAEQVLACDYNPLPLAKAEENIKNYHLEDKISTFLSDGFSAIKDICFDMAVISGMGGKLTIKILNDNLDVTKRLTQLVLQPQHDLYFVRRYLHEIGFAITDEDIVKEAGKFYPMMRSEPGNECYRNDYDYYFGHVLINKRPPVFIEYLKLKAEKNKQILDGLIIPVSGMLNRYEEKRNTLQKEIDFIKEII